MCPTYLFFKLVQICEMLFIGVVTKTMITGRIKIKNSIILSVAPLLTKLVLIGKGVREDFGYNKEELAAWLIIELPITGAGQVAS